MIKFKKYGIDTDGEYPIVGTLSVAKSGKHEGEEVFKPVYFPRSILGAFKILHRISCVAATKDCKTIKEAVKALDKNTSELIKVVEKLNGKD